MLTMRAPQVPLSRIEGWPDRLAEFIEARRFLPFAWGPNDCCSLAIAWVQQLTGVDVWPVTWTSEEEAKDVIEQAGGLIEAVSSVLGRYNQNWAEARRGDVGLVDQDHVTYSGPGMMICTGTRRRHRCQRWVHPL